jgi:hypothetical protein
MSIRDPEVLEALRDQPELLALADAVAETQQRPRRVGLRPALLRVGGVAAIAAGVLLAVLFWPGGGGRTQGILGRALAAIGDDRVMHVVVQTPSGFQLVELAGGRTITPTDEVEIWSDRSSRRAHAVIRERGRVVAEMLRPDDPGSTLGEVDPAFAALWTGYQKALADKTATLVGEDSIYGHRVYWLQFPLPHHGGPGSQVAVDQHSYRPVAFRAYGGGQGRFIPERILLARTEPFSDSDFRRQTARANPLHGTNTDTGSALEPGHPLRLRKPWLTAGPSFQGVRLTGVGPLTVTSNKRTSRGVELSYGSRAGTRWIQIDELKKPADPSEWRGIPAGFVRISPAGEEHPMDGGGTKTLWTGDLVVDGIYVTIETDLGRDAVLAVARALKPV